MINLVFFGSFQSYSVQVLQKLIEAKSFQIIGVITTPPRHGDHGQISKTAVHEFSEAKNLPVLPLENLDTVPNLNQPDFIIVAGYGKLLPVNWLYLPKIAAINMHPSLLPQYAGRFPVEWAILRGESQTGVSTIKMNEKFDKGELLLQKPIPLLPTDTKEQLYKKLFDLGGDLIIDTINGYPSIKPIPQYLRSNIYDLRSNFYARQLTRNDGFIPWPFFLNQSSLKTPPLFKDINNKNNILSKMLRALLPWPGVWTLTPQGKRLKILSLNPLTIQLEGKTPALWEQVKNNYVH